MATGSEPWSNPRWRARQVSDTAADEIATEKRVGDHSALFGVMAAAMLLTALIVPFFLGNRGEPTGAAPPASTRPAEPREDDPGSDAHDAFVVPRGDGPGAPPGRERR